MPVLLVYSLQLVDVYSRVQLDRQAVALDWQGSALVFRIHKLREWSFCSARGVAKTKRRVCSLCGSLGEATPDRSECISIPRLLIRQRGIGDRPAISNLWQNWPRRDNAKPSRSNGYKGWMR